MTITHMVMRYSFNKFLNHIKKNKFFYGIFFALATVIVLMNEGLEFGTKVAGDYTLRMISYGLFILIYLIYIIGNFKK